MTASDSRDSFDHEIDAALEGVDLQSIDLPQGGGQRPAGDNLRRGVVTGVSGDDVIVELGPRAQGVISLREFDEPPKVGDRLDFSVQGEEDGLLVLSLKEAKLLAAWNDLTPGAWVKARVSGQNTGGLELRIGPIAAFMPASHVDVGRVEDLSTLIGESMVCEVLEVNRERKRVLLSRRAVLQREQEEHRSELVGSLQVGQVVRGKVTRVEPFGAFVDLGRGVEGLVHVSNLSRKRVEKPDEVVEVGQSVEAQVLKIEEGGKRIGLGMKQLEPDPWDDAAAFLRPDQVVTGKVVRLMDFGAFVEVAEGVEGLLHVSQMAKDRVRRPQDAVKVGEEVQVRVQSIDPVARRISLSRLDARGAVLGSEDAVDDAIIDEVIQQNQSAPSGTNLGSLFKRALEGPG